MAYPDWVETFRRPGTNITCIRGKYYLYEVTSKWDPEKKRARKKTGKYLGRITEEEGLIPPKEKEKTAEHENISVREYGASSFLCEIGADILEELKYRFPEEGERIFTLAVLRVMERYYVIREKLRLNYAVAESDDKQKIQKTPHRVYCS